MLAVTIPCGESSCSSSIRCSAATRSRRARSRSRTCGTARCSPATAPGHYVHSANSSGSKQPCDETLPHWEVRDGLRRAASAPSRSIRRSVQITGESMRPATPPDPSLPTSFAAAHCAETSRRRGDQAAAGSSMKAHCPPHTVTPPIRADWGPCSLGSRHGIRCTGGRRNPGVGADCSIPPERRNAVSDPFLQALPHFPVGVDP